MYARQPKVVEVACYRIKKLIGVGPRVTKKRRGRVDDITGHHRIGPCVRMAGQETKSCLYCFFWGGG